LKYYNGDLSINSNILKNNSININDSEESQEIERAEEQVQEKAERAISRQPGGCVLSSEAAGCAEERRGLPQSNIGQR